MQFIWTKYDLIRLPLLFVLFMLAAFDIAHAADTADVSETTPRYQVTADEVESYIASLLEEEGAGEHVKAALVGRYQAAVYEANESFEIRVEHFDFDASAQRWNADLVINRPSKEEETVVLTGRYEALAEVPVLSRRLHRSDVIEEADIEWLAVPEHRLRKDVIMSAENLIGKSPRRVISEGRPIREAEIENPKIADKGDLIQITYDTQFMQIRTLGMALEDGAKGEVIRIRNTESDIVVQATLVGPGQALVNRQPQQVTYNTRM